MRKRPVIVGNDPRDFIYSIESAAHTEISSGVDLHLLRGGTAHQTYLPYTFSICH